MGFVHDEVECEIADAVQLVVGLHVSWFGRILTLLDIFDHFSEVKIG